MHMSVCHVSAFYTSETSYVGVSTLVGGGFSSPPIYCPRPGCARLLNYSLSIPICERCEAKADAEFYQDSDTIEPKLVKVADRDNEKG